MLYSQMKKLSVKNQMGEKLGKVSNLLIDSETWKVKYLVVKEGGIFKGHLEGYRPQDVQVDTERSALIIGEDAQPVELVKDHSTPHNLFVSDLLKKKAYSSEQEKIGGIYNVEVATELKRWEIWKFLIRVGIKERRLRLGTKKVLKLGETMEVDMTMEEIHERSSPPLPEEEDIHVEEEDIHVEEEEPLSEE